MQMILTGVNCTTMAEAVVADVEQATGSEPEQLS